MDKKLKFGMNRIILLCFKTSWLIPGERSKDTRTPSKTIKRYLYIANIKTAAKPLFHSQYPQQILHFQ